MDSKPGDQTMVESSNSVGKTVEVTNDIGSGELESRIGADSWSNFGSSMTKSYETYSTRQDKLVAALGNKDSVKG